MSTSEETLTSERPKRERYLPAVGVYGLLCIAILLFWLVICLFGPWIAPHTEADIISGDSYAPIGTHGVLGTDYLGRDLLSRLIYGARMTLGLALIYVATIPAGPVSLIAQSLVLWFGMGSLILALIEKRRLILQVPANLKKLETLRDEKFNPEEK